jgi:hypothetical protein
VPLRARKRLTSWPCDLQARDKEARKQAKEQRRKGSQGGTPRKEGKDKLVAQMAEIRSEHAQRWGGKGPGLQKEGDNSGGAAGLGALEQVLKHLEDDLTCSICLELLTRPVTLSDCGHSFCFLCIRTMVSSEVDRAGDAGGIKYHCPSCRVRILHPPTAPNHMMAKCVKTLVSAWAPKAREEALKSMRETEEQVDKVLDAAREGRCDPWSFFAAQEPIYDKEDGVYRCALCVWELDDDGSCQHCGWACRGVGGGMGVGSRAVEEEGDGQESLEGEEDEDVSDGSYESSFIDDAGSSARLGVKWQNVHGRCERRPALFARLSQCECLIRLRSCWTQSAQR